MPTSLELSNNYGIKSDTGGKMKKLLITLLVVIMVLSLVACKSNSNNGNDDVQGITPGMPVVTSKKTVYGKLGDFDPVFVDEIGFLFFALIDEDQTEVLILLSVENESPFDFISSPSLYSVVQGDRVIPAFKSSYDDDNTINAVIAPGKMEGVTLAFDLTSLSDDEKLLKIETASFIVLISF